MIARGRSVSAVTENCKVFVVPVDEIHPSGENDLIYGEVDQSDSDFINLQNSIATEGIKEPLVLTKDKYIVSGHRRFAAARKAGLKRVPVRFLEVLRNGCPEDEFKKLLVSFNEQRTKSTIVRLREKAVSLDKTVEYQKLVEARASKLQEMPESIAIRSEKRRKSISSAKRPMLEKVIEIIESMKEFWPLTVRQIHYQLLNHQVYRNVSKKGVGKNLYENNKKCYKDLSNLLVRARLEGDVEYRSITDATRPRSNLRFDKSVSNYLDNEQYWFLRNYRRDLLQSQPNHIEIIAEKLTVSSILTPIAAKFCIPMTIGRGFCSLEPRYDIANRYKKSGKDGLVLLLIADLDPDGDEIAQSFARSLRDEFGIESINAIKVFLNESQITRLGLPRSYLKAKKQSTNYKRFVAKYRGDTVYELESLSPKVMQEELEETIRSVVDMDLFRKEIEREEYESKLLASVKGEVAETIRYAIEGMFDSEESELDEETD